MEYIPSGILTEKEIVQSIKTLMLTNNIKDERKFLIDSKQQVLSFFESLMNSYNSILIDQNRKIDSVEKLYSAKELSKIFKVSKDTVHKWITTGKIVRYQQSEKGCNIEIPSSEIEHLLQILPKYRKFWNNL
jgi:wobble nucleotide-excising tRNase